MTAPSPHTESPPSTLSRRDGAAIAYHRTAGRTPGVVFLGGFNSDMTGTKATRLGAWCRAEGRAFLRFDYSGHGASGGRFAEGTIGTWANDALTALDRLTEGPQVLVGSSMGGWIMLLLARARPERVAGLIGLAAAPDFTEDLIWDQLGPAERQRLETEGRIALPSDYGDPYVITRDLIADGRHNLVLRNPLRLRCPVRLIHGTADNDVPPDRAQTLMDAVDHDDVEVTFLKNADHRLSDERALGVIEATLARLLGQVSG